MNLPCFCAFLIIFVPRRFSYYFFSVCKGNKLLYLKKKIMELNPILFKYLKGLFSFLITTYNSPKLLGNKFPKSLIFQTAKHVLNNNFFVQYNENKKKTPAYTYAKSAFLILHNKSRKVKLS